ncbi:MAG: ferredoxin [Actinomycetota bacterium]
MTDDDDQVTLRVDTEACIGGGQCEMLAPAVFEVDDDTGIAAVIGTGRLPRTAALEVVDRCPGRAITIVEA